MFTTEMAMIMPLILFLIISLLFFLVYIVYEDLIEIQSNSMLYKVLYRVSVNNGSVPKDQGIITDKSFYKRKFTYPQVYEVQNVSQYSGTSERVPEYVRHNPRIYLLIKKGILRVIDRGDQ